MQHNSIFLDQMYGLMEDDILYRHLV